MLTNADAIRLLSRGLDNLTDVERTELEVWAMVYAFQQSARAFEAAGCFDLPATAPAPEPPK